RRVGYESLVYNYSVTPEVLTRLKWQGGPLTAAMIGCLNAMKGSPRWDPTFASISWRCFWNPYPSFTETNHLSLVTFVEGDGLKVVFSGDLHTAGWLELLKRDDFRRELAGVNIF